MKRFLSVIVLLILAFLLVGCKKHTTVDDVINDDIAPAENTANEQITSSDIADCSTIEKTSQGLVSRDTCFRDNAIKTKNYALCGNINNPLTKYACYAGGANDLHDISLCANIDDEIIRSTCEESF